MSERYSNKTGYARTKLLALPVAGLVGYVAFVGGSELFKGEESKIADKAVVEQVAKNAAALILPKNVECPAGGSPIEERMIVQDYDGTDELSLASGSEKLIAIAPERMYVANEANQTVVFCGPDYGANGDRFNGNALVSFSAQGASEANSTIIAGR